MASYSEFTKFLNSIFPMPELTSDNIVEYLKMARDRLAELIVKVEAMIAAGETPPFNIDLVEAKEFLASVNDALALVESGVISSAKLIEYLKVQMPDTPTPIGTPSADIADLINANEALRKKLESENRFLAGAMIVLNILVKLLPMIMLVRNGSPLLYQLESLH